jgi:tetratricopeptide (TPR) repeat protein
MGGVGKTQLAVEYIYRHKPDYRVIWWIHSEEPATMAADYAGLADDLDLPEKDSIDQSETVRAVKRWLEHNSSWLLIFDNANDQRDNAHDQRTIRDYIPQGGAGHVIITSRNPDWSGVAGLLPVKEFDRADSIKFLCKRTGQDDRGAADVLADELGDLPLALEQAGAYIETTGTTLTDYQELFQSRRRELWEDETPPLDYPDSVATTWSIAMEEVSKKSPAAADLLNLCAFLAPDEIPLEMLGEGAEHIPEPLASTASDRLAMNRAIRVLRRYSLIDASDESLSVHRLVQAVVRDRLGEDEEKRWTETAVRLLSAAFPLESEDVRTWHRCSRLLPHALAAIAHAESREVASEEMSLILNQTGLYLLGRAEFVEAIAHLEWAVIIAEKVYGRDHPVVAIRVNNLGGVLRALGDLHRVKECFERALAIDEEVYDMDHPSVGRDVNNLGLVLQDLGDLYGAKECFELALKTGEAVYDRIHPEVAIRVNNLGRVLQALNDLPGAKECFERALKIDEEVYGRDHHEVATVVNNLGLVLCDLGDPRAAKDHFERALAIDEKVYGRDHPEVAIDVNNLGGVLNSLGDLEAAKDHFERALAIDEKAYGRNNLMVATIANNLGSVLYDLGDLPAAKECLERALEMRRKLLGEDHPSTVTLRNNLEFLADV